MIEECPTSSVYVFSDIQATTENYTKNFDWCKNFFRCSLVPMRRNFVLPALSLSLDSGIQAVMAITQCCNLLGDSLALETYRDM